MRLLPCLFAAAAAVAVLPAAEADPLAGLRDRPRLLLTAERAQEVRAAQRQDRVLAALIAAMHARAKDLVAKPPLARVMKGDKRERLLAVSREAVGRVLTLGVAHRLQPDPVLRDRLARELDAVCTFSDWHPEHFLDTAEMALAVAVGSDWLAGEVPAERSAAWRTALVDKALQPGIRDGSWVKGDNNWNQVCHGGLALAAIECADVAPDLAGRTLARARANIRSGLAAYAPSGVYPEGPSYWSYGTSYSVMLQAAAQTSGLGDWGIAAAPGFAASFDFVAHAVSPAGMSFNFADGRPGRFEASPLHLWAAGALRRPDLAAALVAAIAPEGARIEGGAFGDRFWPLMAVWWMRGEAAERPTRWSAGGDGKVHVAMLRTAWRDDAAWIGLKGGRLRVNHGHLDAGSFVYEALGVRWSHDLGPEKEIYDRNDAWGTDQKAKRWSYLRMSNLGHSTLAIGGRIQRVEGVNALVGCAAIPGGQVAVMDCSAAYADGAAGLRRGVCLAADGALIVADEIRGLHAGDALRWAMVTRAAIAPAADGRSAVLTDSGKQLRVALLDGFPPEARLVEASLKPARAEEDPNEGFRLLVVEVPAAAEARDLRLVVALQPQGAAAPKAPPPLAEWLPPPR